jgi:hypothetical protein
MRPIMSLGLALLGSLALLASCGGPTPRAADPPRGGETVLPRGTFCSRVVRGDRDKLDDYRTLRDEAVAVLEEAARFPGRAGASSPAVRLLGEVHDTFDESRRPQELEAAIAWFDRVEAPAAEGIELILTRRAAGEPERTLRLTLEDLVQGGAVDGQIDRVRIVWSPGARERVVAISLGEEGGEVVEHVEVAAEAPYRVSAPEVSELYARIQREVYRPLSGAAFVRVARAGPAPVRFRPAPPQGTSFPPLDAAPRAYEAPVAGDALVH